MLQRLRHLQRLLKLEFRGWQGGRSYEVLRVHDTHVEQGAAGNGQKQWIWRGFNQQNQWLENDQDLFVPKQGCATVWPRDCMMEACHP